MIILSACNKCQARFKILVEPSGANLLKQVADENGLTAKCPRLCGGRINLTGGIQNVDKLYGAPLSITVTELYRAVNGAGLPDEYVKDQAVIKALLTACRVKKTLMEKDGSEIYLHEITLDNGITIHLGSGLRGAKVVKITKELARAPRNHRRSRTKARAQG